MRLRKLRIAWSVAWGLACLLLVALWVRSYSTIDSLRCPAFGSISLHIQSGTGRIIVFTFPYSDEWQVGSVPIDHLVLHDVLTTAVTGSPYRPVLHIGANRYTLVPYWAILLPTVAAVVLSLWSLRWPKQFSIRTLLIATTLVAVALGLIVWLSR